jgi:hypothetical protein
VTAQEVNDFKEYITIKQRIKDYEKKLDVFRKNAGNLIELPQKYPPFI